MMWLNYPAQIVRTIDAQRRREDAEDRQPAVVGLASSGISRVTAAARRVLGFRSTDEASAGC
jgi:hypothetical protein